jgi:hypothetical protein
VTSASGPHRPSRRSVLKTFVWGALIAGASGSVAFVRTRGYSVSREKALVSLASWEYDVVLHAARRIAAPDRQGDKTIPSADDLDVAGFIDTYVARMAPPMRREQVAPLTLFKRERFTELSPEDQDRVLEGLERCPVVLLRGAFAGIKSLVFMGYYRDARTWGMLGYDGPWVGRTASPRGPSSGKRAP